MAPLRALVSASNRYGIALSYAQEVCQRNGREVPFAEDADRLHKTFRVLAEAMGYRVVTSGDTTILVPREAPVIEGEIVRPVFGKRNRVSPFDPDPPEAA